MKAEITANGKLILIPETSTEAYALQRWSDAAVVQQVDELRAETFHFRGSSMTLDLSLFPETLPAAAVPAMTPAEREKWVREWIAAEKDWRP